MLIEAGIVLVFRMYVHAKHWKNY